VGLGKHSKESGTDGLIPLQELLIQLSLDLLQRDELRRLNDGRRVLNCISRQSGSPFAD